MRGAVRAGLCIGMLPGLAIACGCGGQSAMQKCQLTIVTTVAPASATANHAAPPPGNQVPFIATEAPTAPPGCAEPQWVARVFPDWANPDPAEITISSADDSTNGTAVCKGPTNGAVPLTATITSGSGNTPITRSVQLTCE